MKKLYFVIMTGLILATLFGCTDPILPNGSDTSVPPETTTVPETEQHPDSLLESFRGVLSEVDICAVSHLGYLDGSYDEIMAHIENMGVLESFPFLAIPKENYLALDGGELYAIIPADDDISVCIYTGEMDESDFTVKAGKKLAEFIEGEPILLKCNVSEIMPNVVLEITANGKNYTYSPVLSGENGKLVETEGVYDFSPYDILLAGIADGADYVFCDKWLTTEPDRAGNPIILLLNLMPDGSVEYACGPANSEFTDMYAGTWSYDTQKDMILLSMEEVVSDEEPPSDRELHMLNCGFAWDMDALYLKLTHTEGDEILAGSWGGTFLFMNEFDFNNTPKG